MNIQDLRAKRLSEAITASGYSYPELEKMTGVSKSSIQRYATGETKKIPIDFLERLAEVLHIDIRYLMCWDDEKSTDTLTVLSTEKIHMIPVFGSVAAGFGAYASSDIIEYIPIYIEHDLDVADTICITVKGQSMYPKIEDGDRIVVRRQDSVDNGRVAVVMIGEEAVVKRVNFDGERLELTSFNPEYPPRIIEGEELANCRIVGLVQQVIKAL